MSDTCCSIIRTVEEKIRLIRVGVPGPAGVDGRNGDLAPMHGTLAAFSTFASSGTAEAGQVYYVLQPNNSRIQIFDTPTTWFTWIPSWGQLDDIPYLGGTDWWTDVASGDFQNSWTNEGSGAYFPAGYLNEPFGGVRLRGHVEGGSLGAPIFTLPGWAAPAKELTFPVLANGVIALLLINTAGELILTSSSAVNVSLDNISYYAT